MIRRPREASDRHPPVSGERPAATVVVVGSLNMDIVVPVPRHPRPGETIIGSDSFRTPGGKGANQAVAAARLGQRVAMVGRVGGDDAGATLVAALNDYGVDYAHVRTTPEAPTGIALVTVDPTGENIIVVSSGANARVEVGDVEAAAGALELAGAVLLQLEIPLAAVVATAARASGAVILNPAPAPTDRLPAELLGAVDVLVPNRAELAELAGTEEAGSLEQVAEQAEAVEGPGAVVVTLGVDGALVVRDGASEHVAAPPTAAVDTTGAGDCFCGALADGLARELPLADAVRWAVRAASRSVARAGAQASMPTREEVEAAAG